jgi:hypothetical protein
MTEIRIGHRVLAYARAGWYVRPMELEAKWNTIRQCVMNHGLGFVYFPYLQPHFNAADENGTRSVIGEYESFSQYMEDHPHSMKLYQRLEKSENPSSRGFAGPTATCDERNAHFVQRMMEKKTIESYRKDKRLQVSLKYEMSNWLEVQYATIGVSVRAQLGQNQFVPYDELERAFPYLWNETFECDYLDGAEQYDRLRTFFFFHPDQHASYIRHMNPDELRGYFRSHPDIMDHERQYLKDRYQAGIGSYLQELKQRIHFQLPIDSDRYAAWYIYLHPPSPLPVPDFMTSEKYSAEREFDRYAKTHPEIRSIYQKEITNPLPRYRNHMKMKPTPDSIYTISEQQLTIDQLFEKKPPTWHHMLYWLKPERRLARKHNALDILKDNESKLSTYLASLNNEQMFMFLVTVPYHERAKYMQHHLNGHPVTRVLLKSFEDRRYIHLPLLHEKWPFIASRTWPRESWLGYLKRSYHPASLYEYFKDHPEAWRAYQETVPHDPIKVRFNKILTLQNRDPAGNVRIKRFLEQYPWVNTYQGLIAKYLEQPLQIVKIVDELDFIVSTYAVRYDTKAAILKTPTPPSRSNKPKVGHGARKVQLVEKPSKDHLVHRVGKLRDVSYVQAQEMDQERAKREQMEQKEDTYLREGIKDDQHMSFDIDFISKAKCKGSEAVPQHENGWSWTRGVCLDQKGELDIVTIPFEKVKWFLIGKYGFVPLNIFFLEQPYRYVEFLSLESLHVNQEVQLSTFSWRRYQVLKDYISSK